VRGGVVVEFKKKPAPDGVAMSELSNGTKKHTLKSRETIPLNYWQNAHKKVISKKRSKLGLFEIYVTSASFDPH
jgi:hypothetical protein